MAGPNVETLIDDLRVVGVVLEPPEASPGDVMEIEITLSDPGENGAEVLFWTCTDLSFSGDCIESGFDSPWAVSVPIEDGRGALSWPVPPSTQFIFDKGVPRFPVSFRVLACEVGLCPLVEASLSGDADAVEDLSDPTETLRELPFEGVSYATRLAWLSGQPRDAHNTNPVVSPSFVSEDLVERINGVEMVFSVEDEQDVLVYGYAEQGGFSRPETPVRDGEVTVTWFPPENGAKGDVPVYVAFEDGEGGSALWTGVIASKN
jgi:hypothetical protein